MATDIRGEHRLFLRPGRQGPRRAQGPEEARLRAAAGPAPRRLQAVFFLALREAYLFLITWDELAIRRVTSSAPRPSSSGPWTSTSPRRASATSSSATSTPCGPRSAAWPGSRTPPSRRSSPRACASRSWSGRPFLSSSAAACRLADAEGIPSSPSTPSRNTACRSSPTRRVRRRLLREMGGREPLPPEPARRQGPPGGDPHGDYGTLELAFKDDPVRIVVGAAGRRRTWPGSGPGGRDGRASSGPWPSSTWASTAGST